MNSSALVTHAKRMTGPAVADSPHRQGGRAATTTHRPGRPPSDPPAVLYEPRGLGAVRSAFHRPRARRRTDKVLVGTPGSPGFTRNRLILALNPWPQQAS